VKSNQPVLLNLDEVAGPVARAITLRGVSHPIAEQTIDQMIIGLRTARNTKDVLDMQPDEQVETFLSALRDSVRVLLPTLPDADLGSLNIHQLKAIVDFANKTNEELVEEAAKQAEAEGDAVTLGESSTSETE
jgi:hypothetical protein